MVGALAVLSGWTAAVALGDTHYVWHGGLSVAPYTSLGNAATNIQDAIDAASDGDTVEIGEGVYVRGGTNVVALGTNVAAVSKGIVITGWGAGRTVIDGVGKYRGLYLDHTNAVVENLTVRNGAAPMGGGLMLMAAATVRDCTVAGCRTTMATNESHSGGGIALAEGGLIEDCLIEDNTSNRDGGGVGLSDGILRNCVVRDNWAWSSGGGVRSGALIEGCVITNNMAANNSGGGIRFGTTGTVRSCLVARNQSCNSGGGIAGGTGPVVENCTLVGNSSLNGQGGASGVVLSNSIVYFNAGVQYANCTLAYTCAADAPAGDGNMTNNPQFVSSAGDYRLSTNSPCRNAGTNLLWMFDAADAVGHARIISGRVDLGACESLSAITHYVRPVNASAEAPYTNWATAATNIQAAIDAAEDGATVLVTNGTYQTAGGVRIESGITLRSIAGNAVTTLDGNHADRCLTVDHDDAVVEDFTIANGNNTNDYCGGGVWSDSGLVANCTIVSNTAGAGGGVFFNRGGTVTNCAILYNSASLEGAGVHCEYGGRALGCTIIGNATTGRGGGARLYRGGYMDRCTVSGNTGGGSGSSALRFDNGGEVRNSLITGNTSTDGGGVIRFSGGGAILDSTISSNSAAPGSAGSGEAVFTDSGSGVNSVGGSAIRCRIIGNIGAAGPGGCAYLENCHITHNQATNGYGGGLTLSPGCAAIGCTMVSNSATEMGGGVFLDGGGTVDHCTVMANTAAKGGGAGCVDGGTLTDSVITGNQAWQGAGVDIVRDGTVERCMILSNAACLSGPGQPEAGGVRCGQGGVVRSCLVAGNAANNVGGGVKFEGAGILENCTVVGNTASNGAGGIWFWSGGMVSNSVVYLNTTVSGTPNHSGDISPAFAYSCTTPAPGGVSNITAAPLFINDGIGDYRLSTNSPCINAGTNRAWMASAVDLDGNPRIAGNRVDLGAYEYDAQIYDGDSDRLRDVWELQYFGNLSENRGDDHDRDGLSNGMEHDRGGNPDGRPAPVWWQTSGVLSTNGVTVTNDYAAVNAGAIKTVAIAALGAMAGTIGIHSPAGSNAIAVVNGFGPTNNYMIVNIGQLKTVAKPFYDRLIEVGKADLYPWQESTATNDFAAANIGQVKHVFSFQVD